MTRAVVSVSSFAITLEREIAQMAAATMQSMGYEADVVEDGDRSALDADIMLMIGDCLSFERYSNLLRDVSTRPRTAMWHIHHLPPPQLSSEAEATGMRSLGFWSRLSKSYPARLMPSEMRRRGASVMRDLLMGKRAVSSWPEEFKDVDPLTVEVGFRRYEWLRREMRFGWIDRLVVSSRSKSRFLEGRGIQAEFVPVGFHPLLGRLLGRERDIDVIFIGNVKDRRRASWMESLERALSSQGITLVRVETNIYGEQRIELLNRSVLSLNLVNEPWELPGIRFLMSMGCGSVVVSEPLSDPTPYQPGEHYFESDLAGLPGLITRLLDSPQQLKETSGRARDLVSREVTLENSLSLILKGLDAHTPVSTEGQRRRNSGSS